MKTTSPLRVLFDGHWWISGPPSGKAVLHALVLTWANEFPADILTLRVPRVNAEECRKDFASRGIGVSVDGSGLPFRNHGLRALTARASAKKYDVFVGQNFTGLFGKAFRCTFVHDAIFAEYPDWFSAKERVYLRLIRPTLRRADLVFTSSANEAKRIARVWPETAAKVFPIGLASPLWNDEASPSEVAELAESVRPFFLAVGRLNERKNLGRLLTAFRETQGLSATHDLVIVGEPNGLAPALDLGASETVRILTGISNSQLTWLYANAVALIFPSLEEGFGLPLLEADGFGLPIAASDIPIFREIAVADIYFNPLSTTEIGVALSQLRDAPRHTSARSIYTWGNVVGAARFQITETLRRVRA